MSKEFAAGTFGSLDVGTLFILRDRKKPNHAPVLQRTHEGVFNLASGKSQVPLAPEVPVVTLVFKGQT